MNKVAEGSSYVEIHSPQAHQKFYSPRQKQPSSGRSSRSSRRSRSRRSTAHPHEEVSGDFFRNSKWNRQMHDSDSMTGSISSLGSSGSRDSDDDESDDLVWAKSSFVLNASLS